MTDAPEMNAVDHFIALYRDGAQGCEMDADDAQVFSKALEAERADMPPLRWRRHTRMQRPF